MKAKDIMTTAITTLPLQCTVGWALRECARKKFQAFPVLDQEGGLRGIFSIMMVFPSILPPYILSGELSQVTFAPDLEEVHQKLAALRNRPIEGLMKTDPPTVSPETSYLACATILLHVQEHFRILPVIESKSLVGLIAPWDLIKNTEDYGH
ncbi:MAG: CBS domain-containing protein [Nitrospirota bacterium]|nr:CBS domain-containing protein [Nitrospirota bacterium]MDH4362190.1 CBS domain-containing protein [Nitrospirota bacterium]MDH5573950.1 CBS domain-containing protein [Nitrospirota bacterium]